MQSVLHQEFRASRVLKCRTDCSRYYFLAQGVFGFSKILRITDMGSATRQTTTRRFQIAVLVPVCIWVKLDGTVDDVNRRLGSPFAVEIMRHAA